MYDVHKIREDFPVLKKVIYLDGHTDTVKALRPVWLEKTNGGVDAYNGLIDINKIDKPTLEKELGWVPPEEARKLQHNIRVLTDALWKACADDEGVVNATIESQGPTRH